MNPIWLAKNLKRSINVCPAWRDRIQLLLWAYSYKLPRWSNPREKRTISFLYPNPVGRVAVVVRSNNGSDAFIFSEVFDHRYYDFDLPFSPRTILDLGANVGFTAIYFGRKYCDAEIACVEPMPQNVESLRRNLQMNRINASVFDVAAAVDDGIVRMQIDASDYGHKVATDPSVSMKGVLQCRALSLPSIMKQLQWDRVGLLKMDVEGYEKVLLSEKCDWLKLVDAICIECHDGYGRTDLQELACEHGFSPPLLLRGGVWLLWRTDFI